MAKILVALDNFSEHLLEFMADMMPEKEMNVFVGMIMQSSSDLFLQSSSVNNFALKRSLLDDQMSSGFESAITDKEAEKVTSFEWAAQKYHLTYDVHFSRQQLNDKVEQETSYADIFMVSENIKDENHLYKKELFQALRHSSCCPLLWVPEHAEKVENIIVPIDESASSLRSLKLFSYLFPMIHRRKKITVVAKKPEDDHGMKKENYLIEMITNHFGNPGFQWLLTENFVEEVNDYCREVKAPLLVVGNGVDSDKKALFSSEDLLKMQTIPIFIGSR